MDQKKFLTLLLATAVLAAVFMLSKKNEIASMNNEPTQTLNASVKQTDCSGASPVVKMAHDDKLGDYLTDADCRTLYVYAKDTSQKSTCVDACAQNWPPLSYDFKDLQSLQDPVSKNLNVIKRPDGTYQYAWGNNALYYYKMDVKPGDLKGNSVNNLWGILPYKQ